MFAYDFTLLCYLMIVLVQPICKNFITLIPQYNTSNQSIQLWVKYK